MCTYVRCCSCSICVRTSKLYNYYYFDDGDNRLAVQYTVVELLQAQIDIGKELNLCVLVPGRLFIFVPFPVAILPESEWCKSTKEEGNKVV